MLAETQPHVAWRGSSIFVPTDADTMIMAVWECHQSHLLTCPATSHAAGRPTSTVAQINTYLF